MCNNHIFREYLFLHLSYFLQTENQFTSNKYFKNFRKPLRNIGLNVNLQLSANTSISKTDILNN